MTVKTLTTKDSKIEIIKVSENNYTLKFYEFYSSIGWKLLSVDERYTKELVEWEYDIQIA